MFGQSKNVLGVDINPYEIRVVEMRRSGLHNQIVSAGAVPTPRGALKGDRVAYPDAVADTLRGLLNRMTVSTRAAVLGVGPQSVITRVLEIPQVPDNEVRTVLAGELAHYQILREGTGAFDYMPIREADRNIGANPQVLLMAVDEKVVTGFRETAERAGLQLIAFEPLLLAMYRASYSRLQAQASVACISVSYARSEISIVDQGRIKLYRRVDAGSDDLVAGRRSERIVGRFEESEAAAERYLLSGEEAEDHQALEEVAGRINVSAAESLATEIQRSIDFYRREYAGAAPVTRAILAVHDPELESLGEWLSDSLRLDVLVTDTPGGLDATQAVAAQLRAPDGLRYLAAAGLAMHALPGRPDAVPCFDLTVSEVKEAAVVAARRNLSVALASSLAFVFLGGVISLLLYRSAVGLTLEVTDRRAELVQRRTSNLARINFIREQEDQIRLLKLQGIPVPRVMDAITAAIDPHAGLTSVVMDRSGRLVVGGEASNEKAMISTLEALKSCPYFIGTSLDSFEGVSTDKTRVFKFQATSQLVGSEKQKTASATTP